MRQMQIAVIDDDEAAREGLRCLLEAQGHQAVLFSSAEAFRDRNSVDDFDCILLDLWFKSGMNGIALLRHLIEMRARTPVIMMSQQGDIESAFSAGELGAVSFLPKPIGGLQLEAALESARRRRSPTRPVAPSPEALRRLDGITAAEWKVLLRLIEDRPNKVIARELGISTRTVETHRANLIKKLGTPSKIAMRELLIAAGKLPPP